MPTVPKPTGLRRQPSLLPSIVAGPARVVAAIALVATACSGVSSQDRALQKLAGKSEVSDVLVLPAAAL